VRIVAPLLRDKHTDPAVVCVDEAARFAIALTGAHERGGNDLARAVATALGAQPVVTTAADPSEVGANFSGARRSAHQLRLVVGVGASSGTPAEEVAALVDGALAGVGATRADVAEVATIDRRAGEPALGGLGLPLRAYPAAALADIDVP